MMKTHEKKSDMKIDLEAMVNYKKQKLKFEKSLFFCACLAYHTSQLNILHLHTPRLLRTLSFLLLF